MYYQPVHVIMYDIGRCTRTKVLKVNLALVEIYKLNIICEFVDSFGLNFLVQYRAAYTFFRMARCRPIQSNHGRLHLNCI